MDEARSDSDAAGGPKEDPLLQAVGDRIRQAREAAGLTPAAGAARAGVATGFLWRMEKGRQNLSIRSLSRVAVAFSTTMSALLEGIAADPGTLGTRPYRWRSDADPRDPDRPLGARKRRKATDEAAASQVPHPVETNDEAGGAVMRSDVDQD